MIGARGQWSSPREGRVPRLGAVVLLAVLYVVAVPMRNVSNVVLNAVSANPSPVCAGATCTSTFTYTGDYYSWDVPAGTTSVTFDVRGASGGDGQRPGGNGGKITGTLNVTGISTLYIYVGGQGGVSTTNGVAATGGWNGGGSSGSSTNTNYRGGGGGASDIRTVAGAWNNASSLASRKVVAGGGGGANRSGNSCCAAIGQGGAGGGTTGGTIDTSDGISGRGGTQAAGGAASGDGSAGSLATGGAGGPGGSLYFGGGGGGGGYYGGGGGNGSSGNNWSTGGGGGSSFPAASGGVYGSIVHTQGLNDGDGIITLTYPNGPSANPGASVTGTAASGSTLTAGRPVWTASGGSVTVTSTKWQYSADGSSWSDISGATSPAYALTNSEVGGYVRYVESASDANGSASSTSSASLQVTTTPTWSSVNSGVGTSLTVGTASTPFTFAAGGYRVTYAVSSGTLPTGLSLNASSGVLSGTPSVAGNYSVVVTATNDSGSVQTSAITFLVSDVPATPSTPTVAARNGGIQVDWSAPANNGSSIIDYGIQYCIGASCTTFVDGVSSSTTTLITGLSNGIAYTVKVRAVNGIGNGAYSPNSATVTPDGTAPVLSLAAASSSSSSTNVSFVLTSDEPVDCTTVSSGDFTGTNVASFGAVVQTSSTTCTINVVSSVAQGSTGTTNIAASGSFSVSDLAGNAQTSVTVSGSGVTVSVPATTTTTTAPVSVSVSNSTSTTVASKSSTTTTAPRKVSTTTIAGTTVRSTVAPARPASTVAPPLNVSSAPTGGPEMVAVDSAISAQSALDSFVAAGKEPTAALLDAVVAAKTAVMPGSSLPVAVLNALTSRLATATATGDTASAGKLRTAIGDVKAALAAGSSLDLVSIKEARAVLDRLTGTGADAVRVGTARDALLRAASTVSGDFLRIIDSLGADALLPHLDGGKAPEVPVGNVRGRFGASRAELTRSVKGRTINISGPDGFRVSLSARSDDGTELRVDDAGRIIVTPSMRFSVSGEGFVKGSGASAWMFSSPVHLGVITVNDDGSFGADLPIPPGIEPGDHTVQLNGTAVDGTLRTVDIAVSVESADRSVSPSARDNTGGSASGPGAGPSPEDGPNLLVRGVMALTLALGLWLLVAIRRRRRND